MDAKEIQERLRAAAVKHGNGAALARAAGCSTPMISRWVRGEREAGLDFAIRVAAALGFELVLKRTRGKR